jgi:hypothetical protein
LEVLPEGLTKPKSVMLKVIYHHIDENRKPIRAHVWMRMESYEPKRGLLETWIRDVRTGRDHQEAWVAIARNMSKKATDYRWFTGNENVLKKPWYDQEIILFKDPQRPSYEKKSKVATDGTPTGTGNSDPLDQSGPAGSPPAGPSGDSKSGPEGFEAPPYTTSTRRSSGRVDIVYECAGREIGDNVDANITESLLQIRAGNLLKLTLSWYWTAIVSSGKGRIGALLSGDHMSLQPGTSEDIQPIVQPRTSASSGGQREKSLKPGKATTVGQLYNENGNHLSHGQIFQRRCIGTKWFM